MLRDAAMVVGKDLRLEWRSRVTLSQILPFALLVLILFAFALDPDRRILEEATPGLFWLAVLFSMLLAIQRAYAVETADGVIDALRLSDLDPAGIFLGKAAGIGLHLFVLEIVLFAGVTVLYGATPHGGLLVVATMVLATTGLAAAGSLYGVLAAGLRVRDTLLPKCNLFGYGQVESPYGSGEFYRELEDAFEHVPNLALSEIRNKEGIYESIKEFLGRGR